MGGKLLKAMEMVRSKEVPVLAFYIMAYLITEGRLISVMQMANETGIYKDDIRRNAYVLMDKGYLVEPSTRGPIILKLTKKGINKVQKWEMELILAE